ncbi:riboflavin synthase [Saccharobesus litoralis]|uniref:Riboflavin synthase n=1 Tax=Saccharobesus litoralis TaxID=2172099 RepID=A0A2S0VL83_9ALTE|nr:riboflavin synthase [Saccharobesus litoralis]AWB64974.1 riboflavin synthase [Saccharobesus litoralis]
MFTGIIEAVGHIMALSPVQNGYQVKVAVNGLDMQDVRLGDSIAVNGTCLTVTQFDAQSFQADVSSETVKRTKFSSLSIGSKVNLEKACTPNTRLGGHIVSGHVDGVANLKQIQDNGNATEYWLEAPADLAKYIAVKGSITVDGISLTVNEVSGNRFRLTIIPHTAEQTTIVKWQVGDKVNIEVDVIARYLERLMNYQTPQQQDQNMMNLLAKSGFIK